MNDDLAKHTSFVNEQVDFHRKQEALFTGVGNEKKAMRHAKIAERYLELIEFMEAQATMRPAKISQQNRLALSWEEVQDLPGELLAELSVSDGDKLEFDIVRIIEDTGGVASLDRLLVELFKRTNEIYARTWLNNKLYRMVQKEMIYSVPGKKGAYSSEQLDREAAETIL